MSATLFCRLSARAWALATVVGVGPIESMCTLKTVRINRETSSRSGCTSGSPATHHVHIRLLLGHNTGTSRRVSGKNRIGGYQTLKEEYLATEMHALETTQPLHIASVPLRASALAYGFSPKESKQRRERGETMDNDMLAISVPG